MIVMDSKRAHSQQHFRRNGKSTPQRKTRSRGTRARSPAAQRAEVRVMSTEAHGAAEEQSASWKKLHVSQRVAKLAEELEGAIHKFTT